jgi:hypothetical protein
MGSQVVDSFHNNYFKKAFHLIKRLKKNAVGKKQLRLDEPNAFLLGSNQTKDEQRNFFA